MSSVGKGYTSQSVQALLAIYKGWVSSVRKGTHLIQCTGIAEYTATKRAAVTHPGTHKQRTGVRYKEVSGMFDTSMK